MTTSKVAKWAGMKISNKDLPEGLNEAVLHQACIDGYAKVAYISVKHSVIHYLVFF